MDNMTLADVLNLIAPCTLIDIEYKRKHWFRDLSPNIAQRFLNYQILDMDVESIGTRYNPKSDTGIVVISLKD